PATRPGVESKRRRAWPRPRLPVHTQRYLSAWTNPSHPLRNFPVILDQHGHQKAFMEPPRLEVQRKANSTETLTDYLRILVPQLFPSCPPRTARKIFMRDY